MSINPITPKTHNLYRVADTLAGARVGPAPKAVAPASSVSFGHDAILPIDTAATHARATATLDEVARAWVEQIDAENIVDAEVVFWRSPSTFSSSGLYLRTTDGALVMRAGAERAFTPRGFAQLVGLMMSEQTDRPSGAANVLAYLSPEPRSLAFADIMARAVRTEGHKHPLFVRTYTPRGYSCRTIRAVLSGQHSGVHFDDRALAEFLTGRVDGECKAHVSRGVDFTSGHIILDDTTPGLHAALHFSNSETGAASLTMAGGAYITAVGAHLTVPERRVEALITRANGSARLTHRLPRVNVGEEQRTTIARERMAEKFDVAARAAVGLVDAWSVALERFSPSLAGVTTVDATTVEVVADEILGLTKADMTEERLGELRQILSGPALAESGIAFLSSAWVAAAFALLAERCTDAREFRTLSDEAGRWVVDGWERVR